MLTRRTFLQTAGTAGVAAAAAFTERSLAQVEAAGRSVAGRAATDVAADETVLARDSAGLHARSHHHQSQQRRLLSQPACRARSVQALPGRLESGAGLPHVADPRAEHRDRAAAAGGRIRLQSRGAGDHEERERGASDRPARHRSQEGRRGHHHQSGLRPDARHLGAAGAS